VGQNGRNEQRVVGGEEIKFNPTMHNRGKKRKKLEGQNPDGSGFTVTNHQILGGRRRREKAITAGS